jgi:hypothetical protein
MPQSFASWKEHALLMHPTAIVVVTYALIMDIATLVQIKPTILKYVVLILILVAIFVQQQIVVSPTLSSALAQLKHQSCVMLVSAHFLILLTY